ncbi:MAG: hypothetical protein RIF32_02325 [Leptospirales bacterium]
MERLDATHDLNAEGYLVAFLADLPVLNIASYRHLRRILDDDDHEATDALWG